ncbi:MAG TPA: hypothetical protein VGN26_09975 [Armatimonadota bacterium]|jgi:Zn ribbon nucleic-acid-binding protein
MFRLIWAAGDACPTCQKRQPLAIEQGEEKLTARCLACEARFEVELTNQGEGTRLALLQLMKAVVVASDRMSDVNRQTDLVLKPLGEQ